MEKPKKIVSQKGVEKSSKTCNLDLLLTCLPAYLQRQVRTARLHQTRNARFAIVDNGRRRHIIVKIPIESSCLVKSITKRITLEVPQELYVKIKMLAMAEEETISTITRRALSAFCNTNNADKIKFLDERV